MQTAILIQKSIQRQATARKKLPSPIAQFKTFLNRGAKPSPEKGGIDWEADEPTGGQPTGETAGEPTGEPTGEPAPAGEAQDAPEPTQGASEDGAGETLPPEPETPQSVAGDAPAKGGKARGAKKRGK